MSPLFPIAGISDNDATAILGRLFSADGTPVGTEFEINRTVDGFQTDPDVALLTNGNVAVAWTDGPDTDAAVDARAIILSPTGAAISPEILLANDQAGDQRLPLVAPMESGGFIAVWEDDSGFRENAWLAQVYDATGAAVGNQMQFISLWADEPAASEDAFLVPLGDDRFALSMMDESFTFNTDGFTFTSVGVSRTLPTAEGSGANPLGKREHDMVALDDGLVATAEVTGTGNLISPVRLTIRFWNSVDSPATGDFPDDDRTPRTESVTELQETKSVQINLPAVPFRPPEDQLPAAALAATPDGNLLVVWSQLTGGTSTDPLFSLYAQLFTNFGAALTEVMQVAEDSAAGTRLTPPFVTVGTDGQAFIGWTTESGRTGAGSFDLMGDVYQITLPDMAVATSGDDYIVGSSGNDLFEGSGGKDTIFGGAGNDVFLQDGDTFTLNDGTTVADPLRNDEWNGNDGDDRFVISLLGGSNEVTTDVLPGGGSDTLDYSGLSAGIGFAQNLVVPGASTPRDIENVIGTYFDDRLTFQFGPQSDEADLSLHAETGNDTIDFYPPSTNFLVGVEQHSYVIDGGDGTDVLNLDHAGFVNNAADFQLTNHGTYYSLTPRLDDDSGTAIADPRNATILRSIENVVFSDQTVSLSVTASMESGALGAPDGIPFDRSGSAESDVLIGGNEADRLTGLAGDDLIFGGDGPDTLIANDGNDTLRGGNSESDLRDEVYGGAGNDWIDGGYGNDELRGDDGNDTISGGFGTDTVIGGSGDDVLTGEAWSDLLFGNGGNDFVNGGFGYDRVNGGDGTDRFFHLGIADHGSDWVQDYDATEGDVLVFGQAATAD
ncbi:hypothetical protein ACFORG_20745, partial [Lutimaribacter marinistellae]